MQSSSAFLQSHPELLKVRDQSAVWEQVRKLYAIEALGPEFYVIRSDTLGNRDDLFLDVLARGSSPETGDLLARRLFEELPPHLRELFLNERMSSREQEEK